ncbi:MAG: glycerol acyltransferase [Paludibacteraceae bacterium]|nr:glycerol acyltransferase [Paludibacteraceae bacterium]
MQFDIRAILRQKAPNAKVPTLLVRYLERITHIQQMNAFLRKYPDLRGYEFIDKVISEELGCSASIDGVENIPTDNQPVIFVSNHPLGGLDGMIIAQLIHKARSNSPKDGLTTKRSDSEAIQQSEGRSLKVIVNELLMYMEPINDLWAPVNKVGRVSREQAAQQQAMWESNTDVLTFPAGACSRLQRINGHWQICDLEWRKNFVQRAREYKRNIVPIYFEGRNSRFFYALAYLRKLFGIKLNIEMLYLVDEMYGAYGKLFRVHVLPPIPYTMFDNSRTPKQWAQFVKSIVYETNHTSR